ncbi:hypothetical protein B0A48_02936 [Cryoendolithus antarcticus]|uniref:Uncharacterized protein n=1 Tax=Cryoendolithus antarcticus TaxID=1507870 RepID=A0A1V8TLP4_9PEZI|nr:hypothetical protein B0A48_02936 [Cryoendolithus antarcticus]
MPSSAYAPILHASVPVSLSPSTPSKTLHIPTTTSLTTALFTGSRKRAHDEISGLDEEEYTSKYLATESSIFFRPAEKFPRCLLWRVLEGRKVVEVRSVDLLKEKDNGDEDGLVFRIELSAPAMKGGVALADLDGGDGVEVFVLTDAKELVTVTLGKNLLAGRELPRSFEASNVVAKYSPSGLGFRHAFRMIAATSTEVMVSLNDGGLLQLERSAGESGAMWRETLYGESSWSGTLKGLVKLQRRHTVQFGELELETSAVVGIAKSPAGGVVWTVGLDHTLKAWSTKTGKVVLHMDMLNEKLERDAQRSSKYVMAAEQGTTIRIVQTPSSGAEDAVSRGEDGGRYYIAVHSPREHQFKLYEITSTFSSIDGESVRCSDLHPQAKLIPPIGELMNTNIWHLEDFHVAPGVEMEDSQIWLSARSGAQCRTLMLTIDALDDRETYMQSQFRTGWTAVGPGTLTIDHLRQIADFPGQTSSSSSDAAMTPTERWTSFLFYPERFSTVSIETALTVYRKRRKLSGAPNNSLGAGQVCLQERLAMAVTSKILLQRSANDGPDYDKYHAEVHAQWVALYSVLENFHNRRLEPLSLAYDQQSGLAWDVAADFASPVRSIDRLELLCQNPRLLDANLQDNIAPDVVQEVFPEPNGPETALMVLLDAASTLRRALSHDTNDIFSRLARHDAIMYGDDIDHGRLQALCDSSDVGREVPTEDYNELEANLAPLEGIAGLSGQLVLSAIDLLDDMVKVKDQSRELEVCEFGTKVSVAIAQQSLQQTEKLILDLLMLVAFFAGDLEEGDLSDDFIDAEESIFRALMVKLRHVSLRLWTVSHSYTERSGPEAGPGLTATLYEHFFMSEWDAQSVQGAGDDMATSLTIWNKRWINGLDMYRKWSANTLHIFSMLLQSKLYDLATDFARFLDDSPWSSYLQGRLSLVLADYEAAAVSFDHAAEGLSSNKDIIAQLDSASLLSPNEQRFFGDGEARYYQGIATLFSDLKVYSHTGDFASKALRHVHGAGSLEKRLLDIDFRNSQSDSPFQARIDNDVEEVRLMKLKVFRDEIADQWFDALVKTGRFVEAYDALRKTSTEKEAENLQQLVAACVKYDAVPTLLDLRFTDEHADMIDAALADLAHKNPASVSKPFHQILYTFRTSRSNFRGAAAVLHEHLGRLRHSADTRYQDPEDETVLQVYLLLINTLACCGKGEEWFLAEPVEGLSETGDVRKLITLEDVRRGYAKELDMRSDLVMGRFAVGDELDVL